MLCPDGSELASLGGERALRAFAMNERFTYNAALERYRTRKDEVS